MRNKPAVFLILVVSFAAIFSSATFFIISPSATQPFMNFGVFTRTGLEGYVPASNSTVHPGQTFNWTLSVTNRMGSAQFVMIIARIGNSSRELSPNSTGPSTWFPQVSSIEEFVGDGDLSNINFTWTLEPGSNQTGLVLRVNGLSASSAPIGTSPGEWVRWIFELWTFDIACGDPLSSGCFHYGYGPVGSPTGSWLQVWFNIST